ncbi:cupin-like domain-containing protein [Paraburkholderia sediminicola]|uniref:cupin-like domain-containing protein n=1 Tax=Paraburkholderia sediminicola TaxID=458836 RepID=UPI0038BB182A
MRRAEALDLVISDVAGLRCRFDFAQRIEMATRWIAPVAADATITLRTDMLIAILSNPGGFDLRSAQSMRLGGARIEGSRRLAAYWFQLLKRPDATQRASLARARACAPTSLPCVPQMAHGADAAQQTENVIEALRRSVPLHLRGVLNWPETGWSLADWRNREGATALSLRSASGSATTIGEFIDTFTSAAESQSPQDRTEAPYTDGCLLPAAWDVRFRMPVLSASAFGDAQLWFGQRRECALVTRLHCDLANSFLAHICGRKRVRLYDPSQEHALYALNTFNSFRPCRVDVAEPDLVRFPRFAEARGIDVLLEPGDLLIIPTGWFHCVWALDAVLSVSRFVSDETVAQLRSTP